MIKKKTGPKKQEKKKQGKGGWYFLLIIIALYIILMIINPGKTLLSFKFFFSLLIKIIPTLAFIILLMGFINYFIPPKKLKEWLSHGTGTKAWIIAITAGIISSGPIYLWYPLLNDLQKKGVRNGLIATFLYNRAVKIPLLPMIIMYFGLAYTIVLTIVMIIFSVFNGLVVEKIIAKKSNGVKP